MAGHGGGSAPDPAGPLLAVSSAVTPLYAPRFPDQRRKRGLEGWQAPLLPPPHPWPAARGHGRARRDGQARGRRPGSARHRPSSVFSGLHLGLAAGLLRLWQDLGRRVHSGESATAGAPISLFLSFSPIGGGSGDGAEHQRTHARWGRREGVAHAPYHAPFGVPGLGTGLSAGTPVPRCGVSVRYRLLQHAVPHRVEYPVRPI
jgi:hypothetical protein